LVIEVANVLAAGFAVKDQRWDVAVMFGLFAIILGIYAGAARVAHAIKTNK
jgi:hypothetical protein